MRLSKANDKRNTADLNFTKNFIFIGNLQYDRGGKLRSLPLCIPLTGAAGGESCFQQRISR